MDTDPVKPAEKKKMIEKLTPEQESQLSVYRQKWIDIGLSTAPLDFAAAKDAAKRAYEVAKLTAPELFLQFRSPHEAIVAIHFLKISAAANDGVPDVNCLNDINFTDYKLKDLEDANSILSEQMFGSHDASWLSFYDFFLTECDLEECEPLIPLMDMAKNCGWWAAYDTIVILQDRPTTIKLDENDVLHCENGPAIEYGDGYAVYSWRGVTVPAEWISDTDNLSAKTAITWENVEQRRAACEIKGWHHILDELGAVVIDKDANPEIGTLVEVELEFDGEKTKEKFLDVRCGTGRRFAIPVPPDSTTAIGANAWSYGMQPVEYKPEVRT